MKVVRVEKIVPLGDGGGIFEVAYTIKTEGNRHFLRDITAPDEMTAFVKGLEFAQKDEIGVLEEKLDDLELIKFKTNPIGIDKEIKRLRKLLTGVNKSGGGNEE